MHKDAGAGAGNDGSCWGGRLRRALTTPCALASLLALLLAGCTSNDTAPATGAPRRPLYFDVKGLVEGQIQQLTARKAAVTKQVSLRGGAPETAVVPTVKWADELQLFLQADINKAALRGAYAVDSGRVSEAGVQQRRYTRRPGFDNATVEELIVQTKAGQAVAISARIKQQNALFLAQKQLRMRLVDGQLSDYGVSGTQKLVLFDTLHYATAARVR